MELLHFFTGEDKAQNDIKIISKFKTYKILVTVSIPEFLSEPVSVNLLT